MQVENGVISANETETRQEAVVTAVSLADESVRATVKVTVDPTLAVMNAYVGDEKILDMGEDYESLIRRSQQRLFGNGMERRYAEFKSYRGFHEQRYSSGGSNGI